MRAVNATGPTICLAFAVQFNLVLRMRSTGDFSNVKLCEEKKICPIGRQRFIEWVVF